METERIWRPSCLRKQADRPFPTRLAITREKCRFAVRSTVSTIKCYTGANIKYPNSVIILVLSGGHRPSLKRKKETVYDERQLPRHRVRHHPAGRTTGLVPSRPEPTRQGVRIQVVPSRPARGRQRDSQPARSDRRDADRQRQERLLPVARPACWVVHRRRLSPARAHAKPGAGPAGQGSAGRAHR